MKIHILLATLLCLAFGMVSGQQIGDLNGINYQAVALAANDKEIVGMDIEAKPLFEKEIGVRFTIQKGAETDAAIEYQETHTTTTDQDGLFSLVIGQGTATSSTQYSRLLDIPWIDADQFLKVEIAIEGASFRTVSIEKFQSVPYSFYTDDIADDAITTSKILNEEIIAEDVATGAIETSEILDETILAEDIATGSVETSEILNETILAEDVATGAIETSEILDETILAEDIAIGSVETSEILNETILAEDVATGAIETSEIQDETILAEDIAAGAVTSDEILDETIVNADIANSTINLQSKVTDTLQVANGGTGLDASSVADGQLLIGDGTNKNFQLANIVAGEGIEITNTAGGITIASPQLSTDINNDGSFTIPVGSSGTISAGQACYSPNSLKVTPPADKPFEMGDIFLASANVDLKGCILSVYLQDIEADGRANVQVILFNPQAGDVTLQTPVTFKFLLVK